MTWTVDLKKMEASHTNGLRLKFTFNDGGWNGRVVGPIPDDIQPEKATQLMREAGEAFSEALRKSAVKCRCTRCGHGWNPRLKGRPIICPACKSPYWDRPRKDG